MTTPTQTHPSLEELAAFLDGKLEGEERARVIQHLDECPDCYETFAGTARFLQEEEKLGKQTQGGRVVPFPLGRGGSDRAPLRQWLPLAAGVILVAGLAGIGYVSLFAPPRIEVVALAKPLARTPGEEQTSFWSVNRGGDDGGTGGTAASFLMGAWLLDRQISLAAHRLEDAGEFSRRIGVVLRGFGKEYEKNRFLDDHIKEDAIHNPQARAKFVQDLLDSAEEREDALEDIGEPDYLACGKWTEAARIAAATRNAEFFKQRNNRRFLLYFLKEHREDFESAESQEPLESLPDHREEWGRIRKDLEAVAQILDQGGDLDAKILGTLEGKLGEILTTYNRIYEADSAPPPDIGESEAGRSF